jgi:hypothetical protein
MRLLGEVIAIGDTANPVVPPALDLAVGVLNFPTFYLWSPVGDWLQPYLTDNGVIELFVAINAIFWTGVVRWLFTVFNWQLPSVLPHLRQVAGAAATESRSHRCTAPAFVRT